MGRDSYRFNLVVNATALLLAVALPRLASADTQLSSCLTKTDCLRQCEAGDGVACMRTAARLDRFANPKERLAAYERACAAGHQPGCVAQASALLGGSADDWRRAAEILQKACDAGEPTGCRELGLLYERGKGVERDALRSAALVQRACDAGDSFGCVALSNAYAEGKGVAKDAAKAWKVLEDSCAAGGGTACSWMSSHLTLGTKWGPAKNATRAAELKRAACERGHVPACDGLLKQAKDAKDSAEISRLQTLLCHQLDQPSACSYLRGALKYEDHAGRSALAMRGCDLGDRFACSEAARLLSLLTPPDHDRAFTISEALCRDGEPGSPACVDVLMARARGHGTKANPASALKELIALCDEDSRHCTAVASLYEDGSAGQRDLDKAYTLYRRACTGEESDCISARRVKAYGRLEALAPRCQAKDAEACLERGNIINNEGYFLTDVSEKAIDEFRKACEYGSDQGCLAQASRLSRSDDETQVRQARSLLASLCDKPVIEACVTLADWQINGVAGAKEPEQGRQALASLCQKGEDLACERLGSILLRGWTRLQEALSFIDEACARTKGTRTCQLAGRLDEARERLRQDTACEGGDAEACRERALSGALEPASEPFARKACDAGYLDVCNKLLTYATDKKRKDGPDLALAFVARHRLCLAGNGALCVTAAEQLIEGQGVTADPAAARSLLTATCDDNGIQGCRLLGRMYAEGVGGPKAPHLALRALRRACGPIHPDACHSAGELARDAEPPLKDSALALALFRLGCQEKNEPSCTAAARLSASLMPAPAPRPSRSASRASAKYDEPRRDDRSQRARYAYDDDWSSRRDDTGYGWGAWELGALRLAPRTTASFTPSWVGLVAYDGFGSTLEGDDNVGFGWSYRLGLLPETSRIGYDLQAGIWMPIRLSILTIVPGYVVGFDAIGAAGSADDGRVVIDGSLLTGWAFKASLRLFAGLRLDADVARLTRNGDIGSPELRAGGRLVIATRKRVYSFGALLYDFGDLARATGGSVQVDF